MGDILHGFPDEIILQYQGDTLQGWPTTNYIERHAGIERQTSLKIWMNIVRAIGNMPFELKQF